MRTYDAILSVISSNKGSEDGVIEALVYENIIPDPDDLRGELDNSDRYPFESLKHELSKDDPSNGMLELLYQMHQLVLENKKLVDKLELESNKIFKAETGQNKYKKVLTFVLKYIKLEDLEEIEADIERTKNASKTSSSLYLKI